MSRNAAATTSCHSHTVSRSDPPPAQATSACTAVATGPYTLGVVCQGGCTAPATGSVPPCQSRGETTYGSSPAAAIRPYAR